MRFGRLIRFAGYCSVVIVGGLGVFAFVTARDADPALWPPKPADAATDIFVVSHGYHSGIVLPTARIARMAAREDNRAVRLVAERFGGYPFVEIGWGDEDFYASVPTAADLDIGLAMRALFGSDNATVLHVVGLPDHPRRVFAAADVVPIAVSETGLARLVSALSATFVTTDDAPGLQVLGRGLYGPSLFFRANGQFHMLRVCNHWVADMLSAAGLPMTPVLDTLSSGLLLDLRIRSGLAPMPASP